MDKHYADGTRIVELATVRDDRPLADDVLSALGAGGGPIGRAGGGGPALPGARRPAAPGRARQLRTRAGCGDGAGGHRPAAMPRGHGPGHQPRGPVGARRDNLGRPGSLAPAGRGDRRRRPRRFRRRRALRRPGPDRPARLRPVARQRRRDRPHLPPPRRDPAGPGAGGLPGARPRRDGNRRPPRRPPAVVDVRTPLGPGPAPDTAGGDGLELRPADRAEQRLLRRLSVFPQDFDLEAATAVAGDDARQVTWPPESIPTRSTYSTSSPV